ncbi:mitochondrial F1F0 ATP synthase associated protein [Dunaliella salina]|uniref:Uncharacterized protein n=2 Tax=Dunaliella TaxID=3044 RepID=A0A7S3VHE3_DUNTE|nr:mitochondrial F1F0 ATP synthase associated protein [Dunaliella salina]|mmetsp:Transcript_16727/g.46051  ORF Transcript_16727/g.46051 Transcript_16727/m.46051 type:complete len:124 (+) Transcript_16727:135-506(+)|eukprot:KAF5840253.1 mitochondrial F1F0 ATP synthase associated protein [Dunaliella salina]
MKLLPESLQQEAATAALVAGSVLYYLDTQVLPSLMREHKLHAAWAAAGKRYHDTLWKHNYSYDRDLRYSAISKNQVLEHIQHTQPKSMAEHVDKMVASNSKIYNAFTPGSKRLMIWHSQPSLH